MSDVERYTGLDLEDGSKLSALLMQRVDRERPEQGVISLTGDEGAEPANLTPCMQQWYLSHIAPLRLPALDEVSSQFHGAKFGKSGAPGRWLEAELDRIEQEESNERRRVFANFHASDTAKLARDRDAAHQDYDMAKAAHGGREPVSPPLALYVGLLALLGVPELIINYDTFISNGAIRSPALAFGFCLVVAAGVALASHFQGTLLKQWDWHFGPHDRTRARQGFRNQASALTLLTVCLSMVAYFRWAYVQRVTAEAVLFGNPPPSGVLLIGGLLMGNVAVFLIGSLIAFMMHDKDPEYPAKKTAFVKLDREYDRRYQSQVKAELDRLSAKYAAEKKSVRDSEAVHRGAANYKENRNLVSELQGTDARVVGCLDAYRHALIDRLRDAGESPRFMRQGLDGERGLQNETLSAGEYLASPIRLKAISSGR